jgi:NAD+ diphosphatase
MTVLPGLALSRAVVDRDAARRTDRAWLDAAWADPATRVLRVHEGRAAVVGDPARLDLDGRPDVPGEARIFLGTHDGVAYFAAVEESEPDAGRSFQGLREIGAALDALDAGLVVHAVSIANWHATHRYCPQCGARTQPENAGHTRRCEVDGSEHYPRTDPAVIMAVVDDADRILLGRQPTWGDGRFSTLAGFVEPGESLEAAVRREVLEEVGLVVGAVDYLGSQPWPFPSSLMLGFTARAETTDVHRHDGEIAEARWYTRPELLGDIGSGRLLVPPSISISRRLIEHWYGGPLP